MPATEPGRPRGRGAGPLLLLAATIAGVLAIAQPAAAKTCEDVRFLVVGGAVYRGEPLAEGLAPATGSSYASGELDAPTSEDACDRGVTPVTALEIDGIDPGVALAVEGQPGWLYVLGYRCAGITGEDRLRCLEQPLLLDGASYYARKYPVENGPPRNFRPAAPAGEGEIDDRAVTAAAIDGVDPSVAVVLEEHPDHLYVASETCLYVAADNRTALDGLSRCLTAPVWLLFEPPLERTDRPVEVRGDRRVGPELDGAPVSLVAAIGGDALPADLSAAVAIGILDVANDGIATLRFHVPGELERAVYESVVRCEACAASEGGTTAFAAGVFIVTQQSSGVDRTLVVALALVTLLVAVAASVLLVRRSRRRPGGSSAGQPPGVG